MKRKGGYQSPLREEQTTATRARIVEVAAELGVPWSPDVSFDDVAARVPVSVRTVFRYFPTQRDLSVAVATYMEQHSGWDPEALSADNMAEMTRNAFAYFADLYERGGRGADPVPLGLIEPRARRSAGMVRALGPLTTGMDPALARGVMAVFAGLSRIQFLRGMHEQWDLDGADAGKAVEWAMNALLEELRRRKSKWRKSHKARQRTRK